MTDELYLTIPLVPPSVNMYVRHTRSGRHYVTREAKEFKRTVGLIANGQPKLHHNKKSKYFIHVEIYLGHGQRGDLDNLVKVLSDGLVDCGAIHSDAAVLAWNLSKGRDAKNPRTEITIRMEE